EHVLDLHVAEIVVADFRAEREIRRERPAVSAVHCITGIAAAVGAADHVAVSDDAVNEELAGAGVDVAVVLRKGRRGRESRGDAKGSQGLAHYLSPACCGAQRTSLAAHALFVARRSKTTAKRSCCVFVSAELRCSSSHSWS